METKVTKEQIHKRLNDLGISVTDAAKQLGMSRQNFNKHLAAKEISQHFIRQFRDEIGLETKVDKKPGKINEPSVKYGDAKIIDIGDSYLMHVPLVNHYAYASYLNGYADPEYIEKLPTVPWVVDKEHKGKYMTFIVKNESMDDGTIEGYRADDKVLGREIPQHHWQNKLHIKRWKDYVIIHRTDGIIFKRIAKHDTVKSVLTLHSLNPTYEDFEVSMNDIVQLYNVVQLSRKM